MKSYSRAEFKNIFFSTLRCKRVGKTKNKKHRSQVSAFIFVNVIRDPFGGFTV